MSARPKLNDDTHNTIVTALSQGAFRVVAARQAGIGRTTLYHWIERGEADHEAGKPSRYADLYRAVVKAEADAEHRAIEVIHDAAPKDWRAAAWYLERRYQDRWGGRVAVEHSGRVTHELGDKSDAELREIAGELADRRAIA